MRTQKKASAWKVLATGIAARAWDTAVRAAGGSGGGGGGSGGGVPKATSSLDLSSSAALTENVTIRMREGGTACCWTRWSARCIIVKVLPVPAPARTDSWPLLDVATSLCRSLRGAEAAAAAAAGDAVPELAGPASKRSNCRRTTRWPERSGSVLEASGTGYSGSGGGGGRWNRPSCSKDGALPSRAALAAHAVGNGGGGGGRGGCGEMARWCWLTEASM